MSVAGLTGEPKEGDWEATSHLLSTRAHRVRSLRTRDPPPRPVGTRGLYQILQTLQRASRCGLDTLHNPDISVMRRRVSVPRLKEFGGFVQFGLFHVRTRSRAATPPLVRNRRYSR